MAIRQHHRDLCAGCAELGRLGLRAGNPLGRAAERRDDHHPVIAGRKVRVGRGAHPAVDDTGGCRSSPAATPREPRNSPRRHRSGPPRPRRRTPRTRRSRRRSRSPAGPVRPVADGSRGLENRPPFRLRHGAGAQRHRAHPRPGPDLIPAGQHDPGQSGDNAKAEPGRDFAVGRRQLALIAATPPAGLTGSARRPPQPAEVPMTRSASARSTPSSARPAISPISHATPVTPPPPSTSARLCMGLFYRNGRERGSPAPVPTVRPQVRDTTVPRGDTRWPGALRPGERRAAAQRAPRSRARRSAGVLDAADYRAGRAAPRARQCRVRQARGRRAARGLSAAPAAAGRVVIRRPPCGPPRSPRSARARRAAPGPPLPARPPCRSVCRPPARAPTGPGSTGG